MNRTKLKTETQPIRQIIKKECLKRSEYEVSQTDFIVCTLVSAIH
jgi:hypothetical protein